MVILHYMLLLLGLVYLITQSVIMAPLRKLLTRVPLLLTLVYCPACTGFWVGVMLGSTGLWPFGEVLFIPIESGIGACAIGALWGEYGPSTDVFALEQGGQYDNQSTKEERYSDE
jgi:hypothetical protein